MVKIYCPMPGCGKSQFGVRTASQAHLLHHLIRFHGLRYDEDQIPALRQRQNEAWQHDKEQYCKATQENKRRSKALFEIWANSKDPGPPPAIELHEYFVQLGERVMNADDDSDKEEEDKPSRFSEADVP